MPVVDGFIRLPDDSGNTGKKLDSSQVTVGGATVYRERHNIADPISNNFANVSAAGGLQVDGSGVTQPVSIASAIDVSDRTARLLGHVTVDNASLAVTGTFFQATQPISGNVGITGAVDVSDRAARLVGIVYGSNAQLKQTATNNNLQTEIAVGAALIDPRSIRALTSADVVDISDRSARLLGHTTIDNASIAVTGTFFQVTQPVSGTVTANQGGAPWSDDPIDRSARLLGHVTVDNATIAVTQSGAPWSEDVTDRAARLLGVVYGSQGQKLQQTATNFNLQTELATGATLYDARQIRALTSADVVDVVDRSARLLGHVTVDNASIAVTGTFFQATQPVSGTVTANQGTAAAGAKWSVELDSPLGQTTAPASIPTVITSDQSQNLLTISDTLQSVLAQMKLLNHNFAAQCGASYVDPDSMLLDVFPGITT